MNAEELTRAEQLALSLHWFREAKDTMIAMEEGMHEGATLLAYERVLAALTRSFGYFRKGYGAVK